MNTASKIAIASVLSIGLIGGGAYAYGKHQWGDPAKRAAHMTNYVADELDLDSNQKAHLSALKDQVMSMRDKIHGDVDVTMDKVLKMVDAEGFDQAAALAIITEKTRAIEESAPEVIGALGTFLDGLDSDQKAKVAAFLEHRREHRREHGGWRRHQH